MRRRQRILAWLLLAVALAILPGCGGVWMSAEYSALLDETAMLSAQTAALAEAHAIDEATMVRALVAQAETWRRFRNARYGVAEPQVPAVQP